MNPLSSFKCFDCDRRFALNEIEYNCPACGGNLDVEYDYEQIGTRFTKLQLAGNADYTMWRYRPLLPILSRTPLPPLTVGWTPIYDCPRLAAEFGVKQLLIKDEGRNPTASFKDRPSALATVKAREAGAIVVTTASSGNAGCALAGMCASIGMHAVIFVPASSPAPKIAQLQIFGARVVLVEGSYEQAFDLSLAASRRFGWYQRNTGFNPYTREGKKTAALEIGEQLQWNVPDKVMVGVGDGNIISGLWKGFRDLYKLKWIHRLPQMIGVQPEKAAPIVDAVSGTGEIQAVPATSLADSINVGDPRDARAAVRAIQDSGGAGVKVSDEEIIAAIARLARGTGVFAEPAAAAAFAGFIKQCDSGAFHSQDRVLLVLTGNGLKDTESARRAVGQPLRVQPSIDAALLELERSPGMNP